MTERCKANPCCGEHYGKCEVPLPQHRSGLWFHNTAEYRDNYAVDQFAEEMKAKLAKKRAEGRGGWDRKDECSNELLSWLLRDHIEKGDPVDVANFCMMLQQRGERISSPGKDGGQEVEAVAWNERENAFTDFWEQCPKLVDASDVGKARQAFFAGMDAASFFDSIAIKTTTGLVERLRKRADEDQACADNSKVIVDALSEQMRLFESREGHNVYAVRMAVDHKSSMGRDSRYAADLREAAEILSSPQPASTALVEDAATADHAELIERLRISASSIREWMPETLPADEQGKIHFARALSESAADAIEAYIAALSASQSTSPWRRKP